MVRSFAHVAHGNSLVIRAAARVASALSITLLTAPIIVTATVSTSGLAMEPIRTTGIVLPLAKPDFALSLPSEPILMTLPVARPDLNDILPKSTATISEMVALQTGQESRREDKYKLKSGEGLATLLSRAGFSTDDTAAAIIEIAGRASLRALPIGLEVRATEHGFAP